MCINFGVKEHYSDFNATLNLRMDDTNPAKEDYEYVDSIVDAVKWLGFEYDRLVFASDYYDRLYEIAEKYILDGNAYVCDLSAEEITATRGTLTQPGTPSPYRNRSIEAFPRNESWQISGRLKSFARKNRYGFSKRKFARPHNLPYSARSALQNGG